MYIGSSEPAFLGYLSYIYRLVAMGFNPPVLQHRKTLVEKDSIEAYGLIKVNYLPGMDWERAMLREARDRSLACCRFSLLSPGSSSASRLTRLPAPSASRLTRLPRSELLDASDVDT